MLNNFSANMLALKSKRFLSESAGKNIEAPNYVSAP